MKKLGKKGIALLMCGVLLIVFSCSGLAFAASKSSLQEDLNDVKEEQDDLSKQMKQVEQDVKDVQAKVDSLTSQINESAEEIAATEKKIKKKEQEMQEQETNLNARLRVMYKNGSIGFIDVLLGSGSISEFVSNIDIIQRIYKNDMNVLDTLKKEQEELKETKAELKKKRENLAAQKEEDALKAEADKLTQEILSMTDTSSKYVGGEFTWPCPSSTYITSSFGSRLHPILKTWIYHTGVDIGASSGNNILAAASGTVIMASWYGGYGNCVMIDHGGGIVTLYGHASSLCVSKGDTVSRGQVIAYVGSTGRSTGPHLHFEVRKNGEYVNPMSYFS